MTKEEIQQRIKEINDKGLINRREDPYMTMQLGYSMKIVLPRKQMVKIIEALENIEYLTGTFGDERITANPDNKLEIEMMPTEEYYQKKMAALLDIPVKELKEACKKEETDD